MREIKDFKSFINEKLLTFGGKAYPEFNNVVILAGGAGSGKGFIKDNLLGIEGRTLNVDDLKELLLKSYKLKDTIKKDYGINLSDLSLKNPKDVSLLHDVVSTIKLSDKVNKALFKSIYTSDKNRNPNLIFDVTLKDLTKFFNIIRRVQELGYKKENISLVWIINSIDIAIQQNKERDRVVPEDILIGTHKGVSYTMNEILKMGSDLSKKYLDGDVYLVFNKIKVDSKIKTKKQDDGSGANWDTSDKKPMYIEDINYFRIKYKGKSILNFSEISQDIIEKIKQYVPNSNIW